jgi:hypothetical protein
MLLLGVGFSCDESLAVFLHSCRHDCLVTEYGPMTAYQVYWPEGGALHAGCAGYAKHWFAL